MAIEIPESCLVFKIFTHTHTHTHNVKLLEKIEKQFLSNVFGLLKLEVPTKWLYLLGIKLCTY